MVRTCDDGPAALDDPARVATTGHLVPELAPALDLQWMSDAQELAEALAARALDLETTAQDVHALLEPVAAVAPFPREALRLLALVGASRDPRFERTPPIEAIEAILRLFVFLAPVKQVGVWVRSRSGAPQLVVYLGGATPSAAMRRLAATLLAGEDGREEKKKPTLRGLPLGRAGALTVRLVAPDTDDAVTALAKTIVEPLVSVLARVPTLELVSGRQRAAVAVASRRLRRTALDLHDGPMQSVALLHGEIALLRSQLADEGPGPVELLDGRLQDLQARVEELQREMREIAISCAEDARPAAPITARMHELVASFQRRSSILASLALEGDFNELSISQELAFFHIVQEALSNVREHSGASLVRIVAKASHGGLHATIVDDGRGFDARSIVDAGQTDRLGVGGMVERARLLGGQVTFASAIGGPTCITVELPPWRRQGPLLAAALG